MQKARPKEPGPTENQKLFLRLLAVAKGILDAILAAADGVLHLAFDLIGLAFGFRLAVTGQLAEAFLDLATNVFGRALDAISISHCRVRSDRCREDGPP